MNDRDTGQGRAPSRYAQPSCVRSSCTVQLQDFGANIWKRQQLPTYQSAVGQHCLRSTVTTSLPRAPSVKADRSIPSPPQKVLGPLSSALMLSPSREHTAKGPDLLLEGTVQQGEHQGRKTYSDRKCPNADKQGPQELTPWRSPCGRPLWPPTAGPSMSHSHTLNSFSQPGPCSAVLGAGHTAFPDRDTQPALSPDKSTIQVSSLLPATAASHPLPISALGTGLSKHACVGNRS